MNRKTFLTYAIAGMMTGVSLPLISRAQNSNNSLIVQWLGHTCFLFIGDGLRVLVNPFATLGCVAGYLPITVEADIVLLSSLLLDEGSASNLPGEPQVIYESGDYQYRGVTFKGIAIPHDREEGRRFGTNVVWRWQMGGIEILHMGGAASPLGVEEKILMGSPDLALVPVGGGPKAYNPQEALAAIEVLRPTIVIPTHYFTPGADPLNCDLVKVDEFLSLVSEIPIEILETNQITLKATELPSESTEIIVLNYQDILVTVE